MTYNINERIQYIIHVINFMSHASIVFTITEKVAVPVLN
jgi:hypothetical protein